MRCAIVSDLHSNLEAVETVLSEICKRRADQIICLGDVVGYGANPSEVLKLVREQADEIIMGNHDRAVEDLELRDSFIDWAREAIEWTAGILNESEKKLIREFPSIVIDRKVNATWTHGSAHEPGEFHYIFNSSDAELSFKSLETNFCFFGHTHIPSLFKHKRGQTPSGSDPVRDVRPLEGWYLPAGTYQLAKDERYLINPGSVGQPRDRNPKLSFAFFDSGELTLEIVRLDYDNRKAAEKIRKAGLPEYLAERLL